MNKSLITNISSITLIVLGYLSPFYSQEIQTMGLYAFSGAVTNWLAIHMLFEKVPGLYGSGIVTARFQEFKAGIRNLIMNQFFTKENFEKFMQSNSQGLIQIEEKTVMETIDFDRVFEKLKGAILDSSFGGMINMFGGPSALDPLRPQFEIKFKEIIAEMLSNEKFMTNIIQKSEENSHFSDSIQDLVDGHLGELTPKMVKEIIQTMIKEHLGWLVVWGGVFGGLIGLSTTFL